MISTRAIVLLTLVNDCTSWAGDERPGKELQSYFVPKAAEMWSETLKQYVDVSGSGDAAILRSLERHGLIERRKPNETGSMSYAYSITEDGLIALATATEQD